MWTTESRTRHDRSKVLVLSSLFSLYPFLLKLFADAGDQGPQFALGVTSAVPQLSIQIVKRSAQAKDFENLTRMAMAFIRLASIRLMLRKLCNPA